MRLGCPLHYWSHKLVQKLGAHFTCYPRRNGKSSSVPTLFCVSRCWDDDVVETGKVKRSFVTLLNWAWYAFSEIVH